MPPNPISPLLFSLQHPVKNADAEEVTVFISEGIGNASEATPYIAQALKLAGYTSLTAYVDKYGSLSVGSSCKVAGIEYQSAPLKLADDRDATLFVAKLPGDLVLGFIYTGKTDTILQDIAPVPPIIEDMMNSLKQTKPDFGTASK